MNLTDVVVLVWVGGAAWAWRRLMAFTMHTYAKDRLEWTAGLTWGHALMFIPLAAIVWPVVFVASVGIALHDRGVPDPVSRWGDRKFKEYTS